MAEQDRRYIYAKKGTTVRDPDMSLSPIPEEGREVIWSLHWQQLLHFGDISVETEAQREARMKREERARKDAEQARRDAERAEREAKRAEAAPQEAEKKS